MIGIKLILKNASNTILQLENPMIMYINLRSILLQPSIFAFNIHSVGSLLCSCIPTILHTSNHRCN